MATEMGGSNGVLPMAWGARTGLPLVDADWMGRAFPEVPMVTPQLDGMSPSPAVITDERRNLVVFQATRAMDGEAGAGHRGRVGGAACAAGSPSPRRRRAGPLRNSVTRAIRMGEAMLGAIGGPVGRDREMAAFRLGQGKVVDIERRTSGGFVRGSALIEGLGADKGRLFRLEFQNENLVVLEDGEPLATVPDIITLLDIHTGHGIVTEGVRYGQRIDDRRVPLARGVDQRRGPQGRGTPGVRLRLRLRPGGGS